MFNYSNMIKRAIEFFPLWTDIRKRYKKSIGGNMIGSMIEESIKVEDAIHEYIDSYFLCNYIGKEDQVMSVAYMAQVGSLEDYQYTILYDDKVFIEADNIKEFEDNEDYFLYEEGKIYIKINSYKENVDYIRITIDEVSSTYKLKKVAVWNIFDEYATFVNTRRYEGESNKELLKRILYITKNLPNGTTDGLKHAICSELMTLCPGITEDEIKIERPTAENLMKPYEAYESLLDFLAEINHDVYRTKRWDLDYWEYDFESISYIPHIWDKAVNYWKNGVGSFNDLEVVIADDKMTTNVDIHFYKKSEEAFEKYIYDKEINNDIQFTLTKYNNVLNRRPVKYKIEASELVDITNEPITLKIHESDYQELFIPLQDVMVDWGSNIQQKKNSEINDMYNYQLKFTPKDSSYSKDLVISKANVIYINADTEEVEDAIDLLDVYRNFIFNDDGEIVSNINKQKIVRTENFMSFKGFINDYTTQDGFMLENNATEATGKVDLINKAGLFLRYYHDCKKIKIPNSCLRGNGCYWNSKDEYVVREDYSNLNKMFSLKINANMVSFDIDTKNNPAKIQATIKIGGEEAYVEDLTGKTHFELKEMLSSDDIDIIIEVSSDYDVFFTNFMYTCYSINFRTKHGKLEPVPGINNILKLSNFYNNELIVEVKTTIGFSPKIYGIYISENPIDLYYLSKDIPSRNNCKRVFDVKTNGYMTLIKKDDNNNVISEKRYVPYDSYKCVTNKPDESYGSFTINLSSFNTIDSIKIYSSDEFDEHELLTNISTKNELEKTYLVKIKNNDVATMVKVCGTVSNMVKVLSLEEMVRKYIPDLNLLNDTIYCSRIAKGLIVSRSNPGGTPYNTLVAITARDVASNLNVLKYEIDAPSYLGGIFGFRGAKFIGYSTVAAFEYISLYTADSQIYNAINQKNIYIQDTRNIPISYNFDKEINSQKTMFYTISLFDEHERAELDVRFHNDKTKNAEFYDLLDWSIGTADSMIAIYCAVDLLNDASYDSSLFNINESHNLSSSIDLKDSYTLSDNTILNTEQFSVSVCNPDISIKYDHYNGTEEKEHLIKHEEIYIKSDGFNKLTYSNIDTIYHLSTKPIEDKYELAIDNYELLKEQGIIIWGDRTLVESGTTIYITYSIKKPVALIFNLDYLYSAIDFDIEGYEHYKTYNLKDQPHGAHKNMFNFEGYEDADLVYVSCDNETFEGQVENDVLLLNKYIEKDSILVKTGYYYLNGKEYYLFSEDKDDSIKNNIYYTSKNIDVSGNEITTYKETNNYISNSEMVLYDVEPIYHYNCANNIVKGVSKLNNLTSCDTFENWSNFGMKIELIDGWNGLALNFTSEIQGAYSYINITEYLDKEKMNYISFYASPELITYIGKDKGYMGTKINMALNIEIDKEIQFDETDIRHTSLYKEDNVDYYLIVQGSGAIDDIIISDVPESIYEYHTKNISLLGLDLSERKTQGSYYRMSINSKHDYTSYYAGLMSDGNFKVTSSVDWYMTSLKEFNDDNTFKECGLTNIGVNPNYIYTTDLEGTLITPPIYVGEVENIKRLIFKINNVDFYNMKGFAITVETCNKQNGDYIVCASNITKNTFHLNQNLIKKYVRLKVKIPKYKYINDICVLAEYFSTNDNPLTIQTKNSGHILSKVYDLQEKLNCSVKSIDIQEISNIKDVTIQIRCSRDASRLDVWNGWREIELTPDFKIKNKIDLINTRFLQFKIILKTRESSINMSGINIEII